MQKCKMLEKKGAGPTQVPTCKIVQNGCKIDGLLSRNRGLCSCEVLSQNTDFATGCYRLHLLCTYFARFCTFWWNWGAYEFARFCTILHLFCTYFAPTLHPFCTYFAPFCTIPYDRTKWVQSRCKVGAK